MRRNFSVHQSVEASTMIMSISSSVKSDLVYFSKSFFPTFVQAVGAIDDVLNVKNILQFWCHHIIWKVKSWVVVLCVVALWNYQRVRKVEAVVGLDFISR